MCRRERRLSLCPDTAQVLNTGRSRREEGESAVSARSVASGGIIHTVATGGRTEERVEDDDERDAREDGMEEECVHERLDDFSICVLAA